MAGYRRPQTILILTPTPTLLETITENQIWDEAQRIYIPEVISWY